MRYDTRMNLTNPWSLRIAATLIALLLGAVLFVAPGCSQLGFSGDGLALTSNSSNQFDLLAFEDEKEPNRAKAQLTFEELQACLASIDNSASLSTIGDYVASPEDKTVLSAALSSFEQQDNSVGFVMMDLTSGYGVAYNADAEFYSASSIKGPYIASLAAGDPETVTDWSDVMQAAIEYSDNDAYFLLRSVFGSDHLLEWGTDAGIDPTTLEEWWPYYSTKTLALLWLRNYEYFESGAKAESEGTAGDENADLSTNESVSLVMSWYSASQNSSIYNTLGSSYVVATKAGWIADEEYSATVDAGIVYAGDAAEKPYLMIIMTDVPDDSSLLDALVLALDAIHGRM